MVSSIARSKAMWPLMPCDYRSKDGTRVVRALTSKSQLQAHGSLLSNCLNGVWVNRYLIKGREGRFFIVGILDAETGRPCSTAEIVASVSRERLGYKLSVRQHTAKQNTKPSPRCAKALKEVLEHCRTPVVRGHIAHGWRLIDEHRALKKRRIKEQLDSLATTAMQRAIGEQEYQGLLRRVRDRLETRVRA